MLLVGLTLGLSVQLHAQAAELEGVYRLDQTASDDVSEAVARATAEMHPVVARFARRMLAKEHEPSAAIRIRSNGRVRIEHDDRPVVEGVPGTAEMQTLPRRPGRHFRLLMLEDGVVKEMATRYGRQFHRYRVTDGGRVLELQVTTHSERRSVAPLHYRLVYRRVSTAGD